MTATQAISVGKTAAANKKNDLPRSQIEGRFSSEAAALATPQLEQPECKRRILLERSLLADDESLQDLRLVLCFRLSPDDGQGRPFGDHLAGSHLEFDGRVGTLRRAQDTRHIDDLDDRGRPGPEDLLQSFFDRGCGFCGTWPGGGIVAGAFST